jgi:hypothetical protein
VHFCFLNIINQYLLCLNTNLSLHRSHPSHSSTPHISIFHFPNSPVFMRLLTAWLTSFGLPLDIQKVVPVDHPCVKIIDSLAIKVKRLSCSSCWHGVGFLLIAGLKMLGVDTYMTIYAIDMVNIQLINRYNIRRCNESWL